MKDDNNSVKKEKYSNYIYDEDLITKSERLKTKTSGPNKPTVDYEPIEILSPYTGHDVDLTSINNKFNAGHKDKKSLPKLLKKMSMKKRSNYYKSVDDYIDKESKNAIYSHSSNSKETDYNRIMEIERDRMKNEKKVALKNANLDAKFSFDDDIQMGDYSAKYFLKISEVIQQIKPNTIVQMQYTQKNNNVVICGIKHITELLKRYTNFKKLKLAGLSDGDSVNANELVLSITGPYFMFGYLESVMTGILTRMSSVATNARKIKIAAHGAPVIFMGDRQDIYLNQPYDGYACHCGGIKYQVTNKHLAHWYTNKTLPALFASMPHCFVQMFAGDLVAACRAYLKVFSQEKLVAIVDYNNDVIADSLKVAKEFGDRLYGVRVDTSANLVDKFFTSYTFGNSSTNENGVTPNLIKALRNALNLEGFHKVKIFVSSGFDAAKIASFAAVKTPVDAYGVGKALVKVNLDFSLDAVSLNGIKMAKKGRKELESNRLHEIN